LKKKIAFIINPISGGINKDSFPAMISKYVNPDVFAHDVFYTQSTEHNKELAQQCVEKRYDAVIAVGGDGTINNTAKYLAGSEIPFGIIPLGSGNGLARHLKIDTDVARALGIINRFNYSYIDTGLVNDEFFINVAGAGFDAHVSWMFANAPSRGFWQYTKITLGEFARYKPREYTLVIDGKTHTEQAFLVCVANGSQYGNNAYIAPLANINDGTFEITVIKPFRLHHVLALGLRMFNKTLHRSALVKISGGSHIIIKRTENEVVNIDGEPVMLSKDLDIKLKPANLKIIVP
jgi:diacylglycerol kinase (ATP)